MKHKLYTQGFTLIEMMVAITIAGILLAVAVPSFKDFITRNAVENLQSRFASALNAARAEAAARNVVVSLCGSSDGLACAANQWTAGWIVFIDTNANGIVEGEEILQTFKSANAHPIKFKKADGNALNVISFTSQGFVREDTRAFATFCPLETNNRHIRGIIIERSGRAMKSQPGSDGIHQGAFDGPTVTAVPLTCS
ncbi:MAG: hypothetical protein RL497_174 [Pseudomonadota bacterium]|jgi:type IV fimbrial biogenesis protein FimT